MKAHIGVDTDSGIIHSLELTTAKESDISKFDDLLHGEEKKIRHDADSGAQNYGFSPPFPTPFRRNLSVGLGKRVSLHEDDVRALNGV